MHEWTVSDDVYNRSEPDRERFIGRTYSEQDTVPFDVHLERSCPCCVARTKLDKARAAWEASQPQLFLEL